MCHTDEPTPHGRSHGGGIVDVRDLINIATLHDEFPALAKITARNLVERAGAGDFPAHIRLTPYGERYWSRRAIRAWLASKVAALEAAPSADRIALERVASAAAVKDATLKARRERRAAESAKPREPRRRAVDLNDDAIRARQAARKVKGAVHD